MSENKGGAGFGDSMEAVLYGPDGKVKTRRVVRKSKWKRFKEWLKRLLQV
jgi:hypothetical protein